MTSADPLRNLGVRLGANGGELRVWSKNADAMELCIFDQTDPNWIIKTVPMVKDANDVWFGRSRTLSPGRRYGIRVSGPASARNSFHPEKTLIEPYSRGLVRVGPDQWQSSVVDGGFDWAGSAKPKIALDHTVVYEAHVRGLSKLNPAVPAELRGTYAGLAHESTIGYLKNLGVTSVELLPVHAFVSEQRLIKQGLTNYWGYNTFNFFSPHADYATMASQSAGPEAVLREFKGMVKLLHEAGLEVILDAVYNHTAEEGPNGPVSSLRGIDNATYYRQNDNGAYIDVTGCGNTLNVSHEVPHRLVLDSLRYWANDVQIDGFRFDLAATLGRDGNVEYQRDHPLLTNIRTDPDLAGVKLIAEPWDIGQGGWQTGNFADGWTEWNDRYRDRMRSFWLTDLAAARDGHAGSGIGRFATRLAGSSNTFSQERGPLASLNFITAHDGFTLHDLVSYNERHNEANREDNADGTSNNLSWNCGVEGPTEDAAVNVLRRRQMRNMLATLILSQGVPMLQAGDEFARTQRGNNNAYCQDNPLSWVDWSLCTDNQELVQFVRLLTSLRRQHAEFRRETFLKGTASQTGVKDVSWLHPRGGEMTQNDWQDVNLRTLGVLFGNRNHTVHRLLYLVNAGDESAEFVVPAAASGASWGCRFDTGRTDPAAGPLDDTHRYPLLANSAALLEC